MGNTIITLLSLLKVKKGFISSMDHCGIYIKCLIQITNAVIWFPHYVKADGKRDQQLLIQVVQSSINVYGILNCS